MPRSRRRWLQTSALVLVALVAAGCQTLDSCFGSGTTVAPTSTAGAKGTGATVATAAPKTAGTAAATGTTAATGATAATGTAATPAPFTGTLKVGVDHPPFLAGAPNVGGASHGLACGTLNGVQQGSTVTITLSGTTGQPANTTATVGASGNFHATFPITQYGMLNASIAAGGVKNAAGATLTGTVPPASLTVSATEVACP